MLTAQIKFKIIFFICLLCVFYGISQQKVKYGVEFLSANSTKSELPFWLITNNFGRIPSNSGSQINASIYNTPFLTDRYLTVSYKASVTGYQSNEKRTFFINEMYASLNFLDGQLDLGVKHPKILWEGLSSSNGNIAMATNARSFPGYNLQLIHYIALPFAKNWLSFKGNYGDYLLMDNRSVKNTRLHTKSIFFKSKLNDAYDLVIGVNHYAQWAGTSKIFGKQPSSFKDYLRIITGSSGGKDARESDQINVLGNQLGSYLIQLNYKGEKTNWNFYWSHLFEDRSGREMANYPDGLYGFFMDFKKDKSLITHLLVEFTYTKNMSYNPNHLIRSFDNYFNNTGYQSGWTYFGNTIGSPYFTTEPVDDNGITNGVIVGDNRFMAFNIGVKGVFRKLHYKTILSHSTYFGWFGNEYQPKPHQFSGLLEVSVPQFLNLPFELTVGTAMDTGTYRPVNFGGFLKLKI